MVVKRENTIVCTFHANLKKPLPSEIHEFNVAGLRLVEDDVTAIQLDLGHRRFYVKTRNASISKLEDIKQKNDRKYKFKHEDGQISSLSVTYANGLGVRWVRVLQLPDEVDK